MLIAAVMFHVAIISSLPPLGYLTLADRLIMATYVAIGFHVMVVVRMMRCQLKGEKAKAELIHRRSRISVPLVTLIVYPIAALSVFLG